jgi:hypothetical protein
MWRNWNPCAQLMGCKMVQPLWETVQRLLKNVNIEVAYSPTIQLLGVHDNKLKAESQRDVVHLCSQQQYPQDGSK